MFLAFLAHDPLAGTLMLLALLWLSAKVGGELAVRLRLPAVTGELAVGLVLTALHRTWAWFPAVGASPEAELLGGLGVVVLMFAVGLENMAGRDMSTMELSMAAMSAPRVVLERTIHL